MNKRLQKLIDKGIIPNKGGVFIDSYNQLVNEDVAGTITTRIDASNMSYVTEPNIIEVRAIGRERTEYEKRRRHLYGDKGAKFSGGKQMCFLNEISGCLTTSPTKDNLVGEIYDIKCDKENSMNNDTLVYDQKDNLLPNPIIIDDYNQRIPDNQDVIGTITTNIGNSAPRHGYKIIEPKDSKPLRIPQATKQGYIEVPPGAVFDMSYPDSTTRRGRVQDGGEVSPTLMAGGETPCLFEGVAENTHIKEVAEELKQMATDARKEPIEVTINKYGSLRPHKLDKAKTGVSEFQVENEEDTASTLISARPNKTYGLSTSYRIRKLTPRECFRLMGVTENDIDKIQNSGVSQSQQYKMAGNSIVVDCLYHMFRKLFTETACESQQLSLF